MSKYNRKFVLRQFAPCIQQAYEILEVPIPAPEPGEVLIRNRFVGINPVYDREVVRNQVPHRPSHIGQTLGVEAVGELMAVGQRVKHLKEGDAVSTVIPASAYQTHQLAKAAQVVKIPAATAEYLALFPTGVSGLVALEQVAELGNGETCALSAAAGGLGHIVLQLIKMSDNHLIAVCGSPEKEQLCKKLGADRIINYRQENLNDVLAQEYPQGIDMAYDSVGQNVFDSFVQHLAKHGRLVVSGYAADFALEAPESVLQARIYTQLYWKAASIRGFMNPLFPEYQVAAREKLIDLYQTKKIHIHIDKQYFEGLESIIAASEYLLQGKSCGKVLVRL